MREEFDYSTFFNIEGFEFADLFAPSIPVCYAIDYLGEYVSNLFRSGWVPFLPWWKRVYLRLQGVYCGGGDIAIGKGTKVYPGAFIGDTIIIGRNCIIGQNAVLRGPLILGDGCVVGPSSEVVASVFLPGAKAAHQNFVGHSILGRNVNLGAGVKIANWKLDGSEVTVKTSAGRIFTGLRKFGAVIGDGSVVGCNAVLNPGTLLGKSSKVGALVSVSNCYFPEGTVIKE